MRQVLTQIKHSELRDFIHFTFSQVVMMAVYMFYGGALEKLIGSTRHAIL